MARPFSPERKRPLTWCYVVAGAEFEPATLGLREITVEIAMRNDSIRPARSTTERTAMQHCPFCLPNVLANVHVLARRRSSGPGPARFRPLPSRWQPLPADGIGSEGPTGGRRVDADASEIAQEEGRSP